MEVLTPLQRRIATEIGRSALRDSFYLTGGTALAAYYLRHRTSVDLDWFTADPAAMAQVPPTQEVIRDRLSLELSFTRTLGSFLECFAQAPDGERVEMDFALDSPYRLEATRPDPDLGIAVDNRTDIACNKLSALFDRAEPKDFVDVYFIVREVMPFDRLVELAHRKHVGLDDYWLAVALAGVEAIELLPRMIKPLSLAEMKAFFLDRARELLDRLEG